jgi:hypothetical protein
MGFIKLGSRVDVLLPVGTKVKVQAERSRAGRCYGAWLNGKCIRKSPPVPSGGKR